MKQVFIPALFFLLIACKNNHPGKMPVTTPADSTKAISKIDSNNINGKIIKFNPKYNFDSFKVTLFTGKIAMPNFTGNEFSTDSAFVKFITEGCQKNGINFGGHYTIIQRSCGAMCSHIFIVDRINGKIHTGGHPDEGLWGYLYQKDSKLLIANAGVFQDDSLEYYNNFFGEPELYLWKNNDFILLK